MYNYLYKSIFAFLVFINLSNVSVAQEMIDEDFLDNIETNAQVLWNDNNPAFAVNTVPSKYKDESAVVFGFRRSVTIDKKSRNGFLSKGERSLLFFENVRFKIKLNDRNSVKAFTEIYFRYTDKVDGFSAKIIKPDGLSIPVRLDDAVLVESVSDVPEFFKSFFDQQVGTEKRYYKVAIPDLEPGDILEYVANTRAKLNVMGTGYIEFTPQYELCQKKYPILYNQINIETDDKSFFKSLSVNGAPDFKKESSTESGFFKYVFVDQDRGVEKDVNFINTYKVLPFTKFQVIYANNENIKGVLIGGKGEIKSAFTKNELAKKAWEDYELTGKNYYDMYSTVQQVVEALWTQLKKLDAKSWTEKQYISNVYYRIRNMVMNRDTYLSDKTAAYVFSELLKKRDINSSVIITVSNSISKLDNILFDEEIRYLTKVNDQYYFNFTDHSNPSELVESLLGSEAYLIEKPDKKGGQTINSLVLPDATFKDNVSSYVLNVALDKDMNGLTIARQSTYIGISKNRNISSALKFTPYMLEDYKNYGGEHPTYKMRSNEEEEYDKSVKALKDRFKEAKPESVKASLENEFGQKVVYKNFAMVSDGRSKKMSDLIFTENFELMGMVRKAGKKYLVNLSGLVGSQLQIKKEERIRKHDINVNYARTINWIVNFKIPDGYTAEGLAEMAINVDNETGAYTCSAEEKNGIVSINIKKVYKNANISKEKWQEMLAFIDAAYDNSFKYLLLRPKG